MTSDEQLVNEIEQKLREAADAVQAALKHLRAPAENYNQTHQPFEVNRWVRKAAYQLSQVEHYLYPVIQEAKREARELSILRRAYWDYSELYEKYSVPGRPGALDLRRIARDKGSQFVATFPWEAAKKALLLVREGKLQV